MNRYFASVIDSIGSCSSFAVTNSPVTVPYHKNVLTIKKAVKFKYIEFNLLENNIGESVYCVTNNAYDVQIFKYVLYIDSLFTLF